MSSRDGGGVGGVVVRGVVVCGYPWGVGVSRPSPEQVDAALVTVRAHLLGSNCGYLPQHEPVVSLDVLAAEVVALRAERDEWKDSCLRERHDKAHERAAREAAERESRSLVSERDRAEAAMEAAERERDRISDHASRLLTENAELRADAARLRDALEDLIANVGGHDHWDSAGTHGANCSECIRQREAKERARAALAATDTTEPTDG